ncbi:hypothetical protein KC19_11G002300 [Ceratodon purpureus]|uniref:Uncharacterized protein n=2 Tax=Ceratodon purpureus TaxID=3225 RepID=A0A8T0GBB7_CERPU|nr:hypothetical protein KC19_11G002300 [Ceratodon purpureus]
MSDNGHGISEPGGELFQQGTEPGREISSEGTLPHQQQLPSSARFPPLTMMIRKTSIVGCLLVFLGGLLWCILQTVHSIQQWQPPSGEDMDPLCWPVVEAYLFLVAQLSLFVTVTLFAFMIPSLVMTWIVAVVIEYLFGIRIGKKGHRRLIEKGGDWAREMSWSTFKSAIREGKVFGGAAILTLFVLPWVLGKSNIFGGQGCH